jgi:hypothetical protein
MTVWSQRSTSFSHSELLPRPVAISSVYHCYELEYDRLTGEKDSPDKELRSLAATVP